MHKLMNGDKPYRVFQKGTVIWRPVGFRWRNHHDGHTQRELVPVRLAKVDFEKKGNQLVCRTMLNGFQFEPICISHNCRGVVTFINNPEAGIPENWTHLVVKGVNIAGTAVYADFAKPYNLDDFYDFMMQIMKSDLLEEHTQIWPKELRPEERRLFTIKQLSEEVQYEYCHARRLSLPMEDEAK